MAYSELIKNFEKVRSYLRDFYIYGYKSRTEYDIKSARTYDDGRRRIESWLDDYIEWRRDSSGKNIFLSVDSRVIKNNPFYKALKTKSFTDTDITLHFYIFDVLYSPEIKLTLAQILGELNGLIPGGLLYDESTVRKKLSEFHKEGLIAKEKRGKSVLYSRNDSFCADCLSETADTIDFFSEAAPAGVIGSFLLDKMQPHQNVFSFKHHYINRAIDSREVVLVLQAIKQKRYIEADYFNKHQKVIHPIVVAPVKVLASVQNGKQNVIACKIHTNRLSCFRMEYMSNVKLGEECPHYEKIKQKFGKIEKHMWGVNCRWSIKDLEHVEFEVEVADNEQYIVTRLLREKRNGAVEKIDTHHYRFSADIFDTSEILPWIRTFICRITKLNFSNKELEERFKRDIDQMYEMYSV